MADILLVEDNHHNREVFKIALEHAGHALAFANDGEEALQSLRHHVPDIVLLDLSLPKLDGWTVARTVRNDGDARLRQVPILALTAHAMKGDRQRALEAGCDGYLSKPVSPRELARTVAHMLGANPHAA